MTSVRVIPCLDIRDGRVVKGVQFQQLRDAGDPVEASAAYEEQGGDEIVLLDVSATPEGRSHAVDTVRKVRAELSIPLTVGGGVRSVADAERLLEAGADKVGVNTAAVDRPQLVTELAERFGAQCTVVSVDAAQNGEGWEVVVASGQVRTGKDVVGWSRQVVELGAGEILLTSWDRDGTGDGYDLPLVEAVAGSASVPVIASGGASQPGHLIDAVGAGSTAVLVASMLHHGEFTVGQLKSALADEGVGVRP